MSEKAPQSTPFSEALGKFDEGKAAAEEERYFNELQGEAGKTDFSGEAKQRLEDLTEYDRHLQQMAGETRSDYDRGLDRLESGEVESTAYGSEWDNALEENVAFDAHKEAEAAAAEARKQAEDEALKEKFTGQGNAGLKHMNMISLEVAKLRKKMDDQEMNDKDTQRLGNLEDRLQELLTSWSEEDDYDPAIADMLIDRGDADARARASANALKEKEEKETINGDPELQAAADIEGYIGKNPDEAKASGVMKARDDLIREIDAAQSGATDEARKDVEAALSNAAENPAGAEVDEGTFRLPNSGERDDVLVAGGNKAEASGDDDKAAALKNASENPEGAEVNKEDFTLPADGETPTDAGTSEGGVDLKKKGDNNGNAEEMSEEYRKKLDDTLENGGKKKRFSLARKALKRAGDMYAYAGAALANKRSSAMERFEVSDKKKVGAALGAIALVAGTYATLRLTGVIDHDGSGGGNGGGGQEANDSWNHADGNDHSRMPSSEDFPDAAHDIDPGEGWFKTMADAGITDPEKQQAILANGEVMGKLQEMGLAYEAPELGGYGISMPENGKMPAEALELLTNAAK